MKKITDQVKQLLHISFPLVVAKINIPIRGIIITWLFSRLGTEATAAGTLSYALFIAMLTFFFRILLSSVGVSVAYAVGSNNKQEITRVVQNGLWLGILLSIPTMIILYNATYLLLALGQTREVAIYAGEFTRGIAWVFIPCTIIANAYSLFINLKKTVIPVFYGFSGLLITTTVAYLLVFGKLGFPDMGIAGIGWGMAIAYWSQAIALIVHICIGKLTKEYAIFKKFTWLNRDYLKSLWKLGWPVGLKANIEVLFFFVVAIVLGKSYSHELGVYQIILQFFTLAICLSSGIGIGAETLIGQAISAKNTLAIRPSCYSGIVLMLGFTVILSSISTLFLKPIALIFFQKNSSQYLLFIHIFSLVIVVQFFAGLRKIMTNIFVAFKDSFFPLIVEIIGLWVISLPLGYLIGVMAGYGLEGFLIGLIIGLSTSVAILILRFHEKLNKMITTSRDFA